MTDIKAETQTIAALMARGYNRHIKEHGPDGSYAGEVIESGDGHGVVVERSGSQFAVRVELLPALTNDAPMTIGQRWAALRKEIRRERADQDRNAADHDELPGHESQTERAYGAVEALDRLMATMDRMEADR